MWQTQNNKLSQMTYQTWRLTVLSTYYICEFRKGLVIPLPLKRSQKLFSLVQQASRYYSWWWCTRSQTSILDRQFDLLSPGEARWSGDRPANFQDLQQLGTAMVMGKPANKNTSDLPEMRGISTISQRKAWCLPHWNYSCWSTEFWSQPQLQPNTVIACNCQFSKESLKEPHLLVHHVSLSFQSFRVRKIVKERCWDRVSVPMYFVCILFAMFWSWCSMCCQFVSWGLMFAVWGSGVVETQ